MSHSILHAGEAARLCRPQCLAPRALPRPPRCRAVSGNCLGLAMSTFGLSSDMSHSHSQQTNGAGPSACQEDPYASRAGTESAVSIADVSRTETTTVPRADFADAGEEVHRPIWHEPAAEDSFGQAVQGAEWNGDAERARSHGGASSSGAAGDVRSQSSSSSSPDKRVGKSSGLLDAFPRIWNRYYYWPPKDAKIPSIEGEVFRKCEELTDPEEVQRVQLHGKMFKRRHMFIYCCDNRRQPNVYNTRFAAVFPDQSPGTPERNAVLVARMRDVFRRNKAKLPGHHDLLVVLRTTALPRTVGYDDLQRDLVSWGVQFIHSMAVPQNPPFPYGAGESRVKVEHTEWERVETGDGKIAWRMEEGSWLDERIRSFMQEQERNGVARTGDSRPSKSGVPAADGQQQQRGGNEAGDRGSGPGPSNASSSGSSNASRTDPGTSASAGRFGSASARDSRDPQQLRRTGLEAAFSRVEALRTQQGPGDYRRGVDRAGRERSERSPGRDDARFGRAGSMSESEDEEEEDGRRSDARRAAARKAGRISGSDLRNSVDMW